MAVDGVLEPPCSSHNPVIGNCDQPRGLLLTRALPWLIPVPGWGTAKLLQAPKELVVVTCGAPNSSRRLEGRQPITRIAARRRGASLPGLFSSHPRPMLLCRHAHRASRTLGVGPVHRVSSWAPCADRPYGTWSVFVREPFLHLGRSR